MRRAELAQPIVETEGLDRRALATTGALAQADPGLTDRGRASVCWFPTLHGLNPLHGSCRALVAVSSVRCLNQGRCASCATGVHRSTERIKLASFAFGHDVAARRDTNQLLVAKRGMLFAGRGEFHRAALPAGVSA